MTRWNVVATPARLLIALRAWVQEARLHASFRERMMALFIVVSTALLCGSLALTAWAYRSDKLAYVYEIHFRETRALSASLRAHLLEHGRGEQREIARVTRPGFAREAGIPRLPEPGEIFVSSTSAGLALLERGSDGALTSRPFGMTGWKWEASASVQYATTTFGKLLGSSHPGLVRAPSLAERAAVRGALQSGVSEGTFTVEGDDGPVMVGFREIPGTNVIVFLETAVSAALSPLKAFLRLLFLFGIGVSIVGVALFWLLSNGVTRPLAQALVATRRIALGQYEIAFDHPHKDEFHVIHEGLKVMANRIRAREESLFRIERNLERILQGTQDMSTARSNEEALGKLASTLRAILRSEALTRVWARVNLESGGSLRFLLLEGGSELRHPRGVIDPPGPYPRASARPVATSPLLSITYDAEGRTLVAHLRSGERDGGFLAFEDVAPTSFDDDDLRLLASLSHSFALTLESIAHKDRLVAHARLTVELETVKLIQESLLPETFRMPSVSTASAYLPASRLSGDWFGHHFDEEAGVLHFYVGDVTGHGIASAMMAALACGAVYATEENFDGGVRRDGHQAVVRLARAVNSVFHRLGRSRMMMTMVVCSLDLDTGWVSYLNAGHRPLFWRSGDDEVRTLMHQSNSLGFAKDTEFRVTRFRLLPGDTLFLFTDGLVENQDCNGEVVASKRIRAILQEARQADAMVEDVLGMAKSIWRDVPLEDDVTLFALRWLGPGEGAREPEGASSESRK